MVGTTNENRARAMTRGYWFMSFATLALLLTFGSGFAFASGGFQGEGMRGGRRH